MGSLIEGGRDATGQMYRRNRYYDPASGRFTQEDPIGLAGGLNLYGFAGRDPVNNSDPFGLYCQRQSPDRMTCTGAPGDWWTISEFLGGATGWKVFQDAAKAGLMRWSPATCQGGFTFDECGRLASAFAKLISHDDDQCSSLGTQANKRFEAGRYKLVPDWIRGFGGLPLRARPRGSFWAKRFAGIEIARNAFVNRMNMANIVAHEETELGTFVGPRHEIDQNDEVFQMGDHCGGLPR